jgi:hypothetical protein
MSDTPDMLIQLGNQARREGRTSDARQFYSQAANLCRAAGDRKLLASSLVGLGELERGLKNRAAREEGAGSFRILTAQTSHPNPDAPYETVARPRQPPYNQ